VEHLHPDQVAAEFDALLQLLALRRRDHAQRALA